MKLKKNFTWLVIGSKDTDEGEGVEGTENEVHFFIELYLCVQKVQKMMCCCLSNSVYMCAKCIRLE